MGGALVHKRRATALLEGRGEKGKGKVIANLLLFCGIEKRNLRAI